MTGYKTGTVAVATVRRVPNVRVFRDPSGDWFTAEEVADRLWHADSEVEDVRPLVVLDLAGIEEVAPDWLRNLAKQDTPSDTARAGLARKIADQIEAQTRPPRIPEPGLWGVVEVDGVHYVRDSLNPADFQWAVIGSPRPANRRQWDDLVDPVLIREGVEG